jgi:hypothetical protein
MVFKYVSFNVMPGISLIRQSLIQLQENMDNSITTSRIDPVIAINNYNADIIIVGREFIILKS